MTLAFREAGSPEAPVALMLHGYPNSSYLFRNVMPAAAEAGWRAVAPDMPGFGDTPLDGRGGTWEEHVEVLGEFVDSQQLAPVALVVHDWGGLIGLRWAAENLGSDRRRAHLTLYRSGDFEKLAPHEGALGRLGVPTLVLWGAQDSYAPVSGAHRFVKEIPDARLVVLEAAGHFLMEDDSERVATEIGNFLADVGP